MRSARSTGNCLALRRLPCYRLRHAPRLPSDSFQSPSSPAPGRPRQLHRPPRSPSSPCQSLDHDHGRLLEHPKSFPGRRLIHRAPKRTGRFAPSTTISASARRRHRSGRSARFRTRIARHPALERIRGRRLLQLSATRRPARGAADHARQPVPRDQRVGGSVETGSFIMPPRGFRVCRISIVAEASSPRLRVAS